MNPVIFEKIILWFWKDHTVCGWGMTCKYRCQKNASALKVNYVTNDGIVRFEKSHTHSRPKRWRREHQSTNYRLHFFVWLKRWITNRDFFFLLWVTSHRCLYQKVTDKVRDGFSHSRCLSAEILSVHALHSGSVPFHTRTEMLWLGPADRALHPPTYPSQKQSGILFLSAPWTRSCFRLPQSLL